MTQSGHERVRIAAAQTDPQTPFRRSQIPAVIPTPKIGIVLSLGIGAMRRRSRASSKADKRAGALRSQWVRLGRPAPLELTDNDARTRNLFNAMSLDIYPRLHGGWERDGEELGGVPLGRRWGSFPLENPPHASSSWNATVFWRS
jgi:hypothetical protein